jgi:hypothetical protein
LTTDLFAGVSDLHSTHELMAEGAVFHGVAPLADGEHALLGRQRINLTFRKAL